MTILDKIEQVAAVLDSQGRPEQEIRVIASRKHLMSRFKPSSRGGQLYCGKHPIVLGRASASHTEQAALL